MRHSDERKGTGTGYRKGKREEVAGHRDRDRERDRDQAGTRDSSPAGAWQGGAQMRGRDSRSWRGWCPTPLCLCVWTCECTHKCFTHASHTCITRTCFACF